MNLDIIIYDVVVLVIETYIIAHAGRNKKKHGEHNIFDDQELLNCLFPVNLLLQTVPKRAFNVL